MARGDTFLFVDKSPGDRTNCRPQSTWSAAIAGVFISYSSRYRDVTEVLAKRLEANGYPVWWDHALEGWGSFEGQIREALQDAAAVLVIWSEGSAKSDWVRAEVERARLAHKLINVRAPDFPLGEVPSHYSAVDHIHTLDVDNLGPILKSIDTVWRGAVPTGIKPRHASHRDLYGVDLFSSNRRPLGGEEFAILLPHSDLDDYWPPSAGCFGRRCWRPALQRRFEGMLRSTGQPGGIA